MLRDANFPCREQQGKWDRTYLKIQAQKTVEELQESENRLRNCKQRMVISGKYFKNPMETDQIIFYELAPFKPHFVDVQIAFGTHVPETCYS